MEFLTKVILVLCVLASVLSTISILMDVNEIRVRRENADSRMLGKEKKKEKRKK